MTPALSAMLPTSCEEHELVAAVRGGDERAFEELFARYGRRIAGYVRGMVGDHARAEDITQEVFISALRRIRDTERPITFKPWIFEIAKNACIDEFRRNRRSHEVPFDDDHGAVAARMTPAAYELTPQAALESKQRLDDLRGAFVGLSESHHRILVLRELEGLSYGEIGERLGMSRPMVESTLFRARRRLSEEYDDLLSGRRCAQVRGLIDSADGQSLQKLGIRDRRRLARHLSHCQLCRRHARIGGVDESVFQAPRPVARLAALLLPWLPWRRGSSHDERLGQTGSHSITIAQSFSNVAQLVDPLGPSVVLERAAAAVAAVAIASAGGGLVSGLTGPGAGRRPLAAPPSATTGVPPSVLSLTNVLKLPRSPSSALPASESSGLEPLMPGTAPSSAAATGAGQASAAQGPGLPTPPSAPPSGPSVPPLQGGSGGASGSAPQPGAPLQPPSGPSQPVTAPPASPSTGGAIVSSLAQPSAPSGGGSQGSPSDNPTGNVPTGDAGESVQTTVATVESSAPATVEQAQTSVEQTATEVAPALPSPATGSPSGASSSS